MTTHVGSILPVGTIIHSMLTTTQFDAVYGSNWVLMDGRSVTGTKYASVTGNSTIPDARGAFLRAKGATYNPDGDLAVGTYTADKLPSHTHTTTIPRNGGFVGTVYGLQMENSVANETIASSATGGNETAPRSVTVNVFIRIN